MVVSASTPRRVRKVRVPKLLAIGFLAGGFGALFGVGGGIVIVPLLMLLLAFDQRRAGATSLAAILASSIAGAITYAFHGDVKPGAAALVGLPAVLGVLGGTAIQQRIPVARLSYLFALLLAVIGVRLLV
ncbi:MAG TPA: sulfite exporter TauE/SafE family protein [Gaiellaceae bacterium]